MSNAKLQSTIANAICKADSSYFFEDYTKQAKAVLQAIEKAGFSIVPSDAPAATWEKVAEQMRTGRVKPHEHVQNVYETALRVLKQ